MLQARSPAHVSPAQHVRRSQSLGSMLTRHRALPEAHIEFLNHRGKKLVGTLTDPEGPTQNATGAGPQQQQQQALPPVLIMAHGYMSTRNSELLVRLATALARSCQLSSFRFDFSGNGDSEGDFRYGQYRCVGGSTSLKQCLFLYKNSEALWFYGCGVHTEQSTHNKQQHTDISVATVPVHLLPLPPQLQIKPVSKATHLLAYDAAPLMYIISRVRNWGFHECPAVPRARVKCNVAPACLPQ